MIGCQKRQVECEVNRASLHRLPLYDVSPKANKKTFTHGMTPHVVSKGLANPYG